MLLRVALPFAADGRHDLARPPRPLGAHLVALPGDVEVHHAAGLGRRHSRSSLAHAMLRTRPLAGHLGLQLRATRARRFSAPGVRTPSMSASCSRKNSSQAMSSSAG
eukprot:9428534-Pyramimonas_sp.AAC.1